MKATEGDTTVRLKTIEMQKEVELRKLDIEEEVVRLQNDQLAYHETKLLTDQSVPAASSPGLSESQQMKNRVAFCRGCGKKAYFSAANRSPDLCDDHNADFARAYLRCAVCNEAVRVEHYALASKVCPACVMAGKG